MFNKGIAKQQSTKRKLRPIGIRLLEDLIACLEDNDSHFRKLLLKAGFLIMYHDGFRIGDVVDSSNPDHGIVLQPLFLIQEKSAGIIKGKVAVI